MRDSARLNSWRSFLVTLRSISLEIWVMYSSAIAGLSVFCDWLFFVFSGLSKLPITFSFFLRVAINLREKLVSCEDWNDLFFFNSSLISYFYEVKGSNNSKQLMMENFVYNTREATIYIILTILAFLLFIHFPWRETYLFTQQFQVQIRKSALIIIFIKEKCRLWRETNTFPSIYSLTDRVFSIFRQKIYVSNPSEMNIKMLIPAPTR